MTRQIALRNSEKFLIVSDEDYAQLSQFKWYLNPSGYAHTTIKGKTFRAHQLVLSVKPPACVDHKDRNRLNCARDNLRPASRSQNGWNASKRGQNTASTYKGVKRHRKLNKWVASINQYGQRLHLGVFEDEAFAARVYDAAACDLFGEYAAPNFPGEPICEEARRCYQAAQRRQTSSRFRGVMWAKVERKWKAYIYVGAAHIHLGYFVDEVEAALVRDRYILDHGLTRHKLNFPDALPDAETKADSCCAAPLLLLSERF